MLFMDSAMYVLKLNGGSLIRTLLFFFLIYTFLPRANRAEGFPLLGLPGFAPGFPALPGVEGALPLAAFAEAEGAFAGAAGLGGILCSCEDFVFPQFTVAAAIKMIALVVYQIGDFIFEIIIINKWYLNSILN